MQYILVFLIFSCYLSETMSKPTEELSIDGLHTKNVKHIVKRLAVPGCQSGQVKLPYTTWRAGNSHTEIVYFDPPFTSTPALVYGLSKLDSIKSENVRITTAVNNLSSRRFTFNLKSWDVTLTYEAWVQWMACPKTINI